MIVGLPFGNPVESFKPNVKSPFTVQSKLLKISSKGGIGEGIGRDGGGIGSSGKSEQGIQTLSFSLEAPQGQLSLSLHPYSV